MYPEEMVKPMQAEFAGFQDLHSAEAVENAMKPEGTTLVVVNCLWLCC
jgi:putative YphP/YqiW family bacilliredoxin